MAEATTTPSTINRPALFGTPTLAGAVAARCHRGPGSPEQVQKAKVRQAVAAGFLPTVVGALMVTVLGTATVALMPRAGWPLHWLYPGQHLPAAVAYTNELTASVRADGYGVILLAFPVIGLVMGLAGGGLAAPAPAAPPGLPPGGGGPPRPPGHPAPDPPGGIRLAAAGADGLPAGLPGFAGDSPYRAEPALPRAG
jgi:hypothetical protein